MESYERQVATNPQHLQAVLWAEAKSESLALALANRSVILAKMKFHIEAVHDLEAVLKSGDYPKATVYKLYQVG